MSDARTYGLTTRAAELLAVIRAWKVEHGHVPTYAEMATELGVASKSTVHRLLGQLEERGIVRRLFHKAQSVEVIELGSVMLPADLIARLGACAEAFGQTPDELAADAIRAFLPSPTTAAREREWSSSPSPF